MLPHPNLHQQVAVGASVGAHAALAPDTDGLAVVHTGRDLDLDPVVSAHLALAFAGVAGGFDDLAPAAALAAGGGGLHLHTHEALHHPLLAGAVAAGAGFHLAVGGAAAVARGAVLDPGGGDLLLTTEGGLLKGQLQPGHHILAPAGGILAGAPAGPAAEEVPEYVREAAEISEAAEARAARARAEVGVNPREAVLVVAGLLIGIGQHLVGLAHLLKPFLGFLVPGVPVGVVFHGHLSIGPFDLIGAGALVNPQHLVIVTFVVCHTFHLTVNTFPRGKVPRRGG